ncbi:MAG: TIM barrel protein [Actinomycetota bacterium]
MNTVTLACSSSAFADISLVEAIRKIANIGYPAVDILAGHEMIDEDYPYDNVLQRIKAELNNHNMLVSNITIGDSLPHASISSTSMPPAERNIWSDLQHICRVKHYIKVARALNCSSVTVSPGRITGKPVDLAQISNLISGLNEVTKFGRGLGVVVGITYGPGLTINNAELIKPILIKCRGLKLSFHVGNSHMACETPCRIAADFKHSLSHIYIADIGSGDRLYLVPGMGEIEWISFFRTLRWIGYNKFVTVDLSSYRDNPTWAATRAYYYLTNIINGLKQANKQSA